MNDFDRLNQFRVMWLMVFFDLPTETKMDRSNATQFRKKLLKNGFCMFQFSIYVRHCPSRENAVVHNKRIKGFLPPDGHVGILMITDKQFGMIELFYSRNKADLPGMVQQLELF